ncbi:MAG: [FeFe] hydrogenase H-cluster radical SAM maturase HydE [Fibromonadaceae bacterium]|jgi:biotin synthase|nr:[FeFe] hydrogenase H-cluster radical SAM maturase HydE [Fibromonadaceae bacterium]
MKELIDKLENFQILSREEFKEILHSNSDYLFERARYAAQKVYGKNIFMRGLIEFTNYCKNNCYYCGLRLGNKKTQRYRLSKEQILECCKIGYPLGFRTFVLQGGEDTYCTDEILIEIISEIKTAYPDCAITLSIGERNYESYERLFRAGADRYLLRHETASDEHYKTLHPASMSLASRKKCLCDLKKLGYQVGCGFMVGSPSQTLENIVDDLLFIKELKPQMAGIGPFIPHSETPFKKEKAGDLRLTLNIIAMLRLMQPNLLIPATTALGTLDSNGHKLGILAGANVVMPNLSPLDARKKYMLYNNKICASEEAAECVARMQSLTEKIEYKIIVSRGDCAV